MSIRPNPPEFQTFGEAAAYFFERFSESAPLRFRRYLELSNGREIEAAAKYRWNLELSAALIPCLHTAELTLRNAIHQAMCLKYPPSQKASFPNGAPADGQWWFDAATTGGSLLQARDYLRVKEAFDKAAKTGSVSTPRVVAELPFGFWVELLNSSYDEKLVVPLLGSTMKKVQRDNPRNRTHGWLRSTFGQIRDLRNRVSHHEPIIARKDLDFTWEIAWLISSQTYPVATSVLKKSCRYRLVKSAQWHDQEKEIRAEVNDLFERFRRR